MAFETPEGEEKKRELERLERAEELRERHNEWVEYHLDQLRNTRESGRLFGVDISVNFSFLRGRIMKAVRVADEKGRTSISTVNATHLKFQLPDFIRRKIGLDEVAEEIRQRNDADARRSPPAVSSDILLGKKVVSMLLGAGGLDVRISDQDEKQEGDES